MSVFIYKDKFGNKKGFSFIELLISLSLAMVVFYSVVEYWCIMTKFTNAKHLEFKYLLKMVTEGTLLSVDENAMINEFAAIGCPITNPSTDIEATSRESLGQPRINRPNEVSLKIKCTPVPTPLTMGRIIGATTPDGNFKIYIGGSIQSEYVPY